MKHLEWRSFHGRVMRVLERRPCALLVAVILSLPAVTWANQDPPWILVDTQALTLTVFSAENHALARFSNIAIGSGGIAEAHHRGDATTPLGTFHVSRIDRHSRFDTFYGLDYPSAPIARRAHAEGNISQAELDAILQALRHHRTPPQNTSLGGQLGIHGLGHGNPGVQQAVNWTDGCVALTNRQIRLLSRWIQVGSRVVIR
jgi:murein L,D-transpeptidase YafK